MVVLERLVQIIVPALLRLTAHACGCGARMYMYIWIRLRLGKSAAVVKGGAALGRCMRTACERLPFTIFQGFRCRCESRE